jgi:hypothetical protein
LSDKVNSHNVSASSLQICYYRLVCNIENIKLLEYSGSQLRGAFGYALKKVCCINPSFECNGCFAATQCLYYDFYEEKSKSHKYRFVPSSTNEFDLYLYEKATEKLPYILSALKMMVEEQGLGAGRKIGKLSSITTDAITIYDGVNFNLTGISPIRFEPKQSSKKLQINFLTPLRLKSNEKRVSLDEIDIVRICLSILRRYDELLDSPRQKHFVSTNSTLINKQLAFTDTTSYSNRQSTKMNLGGFTGKFLSDNVESEIANILQLGEIIGVGKSCVFGLGHIKLEEAV